MTEFAAVPSAASATLVVMLVLLEAIVLYVGYGMIEERLAPSILAVIANV